MDIAVIGPEKFAFQDMACIELALSYRPFGTFVLVPEPKGGEDAGLTWRAPRARTLEVQVKGAAGTAGISELANYLAHYPSHKAKGSLLERLFDDEARHALFILTARCDDHLAPLLLKRPLAGLPAARPAPRALAESLRNAFAKMAAAKPPKKVTRLASARLKDFAALAARPIADFERALARIGIADQETAESIEVRLHALLRADRFDTLSIRGMLARLSDLLAQSKRSQADAIAPMLRELAARAPGAVRPDGYLDRGIEAGLEARLREERVLLLAGPPRAGKSWTARAIGGRLQGEGFEVRQGAFVEEAERFLTDDVGAERVYVLDDPIGAREPVVDASARLAGLRALSERIPANRRLIVAQSEHVLLQTRSAANLSGCALGARQWHRLEPLAVERAQAIWREAAEVLGVPVPAIVRVEQLIARDPGLRDPGALAYLAQTWDELPEPPLDEEILHQARRDASDFARTLMSQAPAIGDLLTASALATTASEGAAEEELAFIVNGGEARPALQPSSYLIALGDERSPPPRYEVTPALDLDQRLAVETLQRRRVLEARDVHLNFTHPYLRAGAQTLVAPDIPADRQRILGQIDRAIACASPATSLAAARNLRWLRLALPDHGASDVFGVARHGIRSRFPATRDCCFQFLVEFADQLPDDFKERLPRWSERMVVDLDDIDVAHGIGFISDQPNWFPEASPIQEIRPYLEAIDTGAPLALDLSLSRRLLLTLDEHPCALTLQAARRFLRADEAVVRAAAARIWCRLPREDDADVLDRIQGDAAPAISLGLLDELASSWDSLDDLRRERILAILLAHARSPGCASVLFGRLVQFNRVEHFGERPPWRIFTAVMPIVIAHLPLSVDFDNGRFNAVLDDALEVVPANSLSAVLEAWAARLSQRLDRYFLTEFELAIVQPLVQGMAAEARLPILRGVFGVADTGARVVTTKWLAADWDALSPAEHALLADVLGEERIDRHWLTATVLTLGEPPKALVDALTGDPETLGCAPDEIERRLGAKLFAACVHMFVGWPQPLWWYATHHSDSPDWTRVIRHLARLPDHPLHAVAFYEIANFGEHGELAELVGELPDAELPNIFARLLDFKASHVGDWRQQAWQKLLTRAEATGLLDGFLAQIDVELEGILENVPDIRHWLGEGDLALRVLKLVANDAHALIRARNLQKTRALMDEQLATMDNADTAMAGEIFAGLCADALATFEAEPPRLHGTWSEIGHIFKDVGASAETLAAIEARRLEAVERHHAIRDRFDGAPPEVPLEGWIDQARLNR